MDVAGEAFRFLKRKLRTAVWAKIYAAALLISRTLPPAH